jgi:hypothetical protein
MPKRLKFKYHLNTLLVPEDKESYIYVFASNLAGIHRTELGNIAQSMFGAESGISIGFYSRSYALPLKDRFIRYLSLEEIKKYVELFKAFTLEHPEMKFWIPDLCTEKKGYRAYHLAHLFKGCGSNCCFPLSWKSYLK